jgi:hypothetical protein
MHASNLIVAVLTVECVMTLEQFLDATASVAEPVLRSAMVVALSVEPARTAAAYPRFYARVLHELSGGPDGPPLPGADLGDGPECPPLHAPF